MGLGNVSKLGSGLMYWVKIILISVCFPLYCGTIYLDCKLQFCTISYISLDKLT